MNVYLHNVRIIKSLLSRVMIAPILACLLFSQYGITIAAATGLSADQQKLLREGVSYFNSCGNSGDNSSTNVSTSTGSTSGWVTTGATIDDFTGGTMQTGLPTSYNNGMTYAELLLGGTNAGLHPNLGELLGKSSAMLPSAFSIDIMYNGKIITDVQRIDTGSGQAGNSHYTVDIERPAASALGFPGKADVQVRIHDPNATATPTSSSATSPSDSGQTSCCPSSTNNTSSGSSQPTIVLDPGHAGANTEEVDPTSGLETVESGGAPGEMQNMWDTAQVIKTKLAADGYNVALTKNSEDDTAGLVTKAKRADAANAALAVSLHYTGGVPFGQANDHFGVTPQEVGRFRQNNDNGKRKAFTDAAIAQKSQQYAQNIAAERTKTGDNAKVVPLDQSFPSSRPDIKAFGDISMVQLLSNTPWVYNEVGASGFDKQKYADGITNGIEKAVPVSSSSTPSGSGSSASSCCPTANLAGGVAGSIPTSLTGSDNGAKAFNFFLQVGLTPPQAAGIVANLFNESSVDPTSGGSPSSGVFGIAQWTPGSKFAADKQLNHISGSDTDLLTQLTVLWAEINGLSSQGFGNILNGLKQITDPGAAAVYFRDNLEKCDMSKPSCSDRAGVGAQMLQKYGNGSGSSGGGGCQSSSSSPQCQTATGDAKIICEAQKYDPTSYSWDGGHGPPADWHKNCPTIGPSCSEDCSGLVDLAVYDAFNVDLGGQNTDGERTDSTHWKQVSVDQIQPGDIVQPDTGHVEIIDHVSGNTLYTFGAHDANTSQPLQVGPITWPKSSGFTYWHYIGPGS
jgi:N-acetylmuramoyl-L-alanine amidase